MSELLEITQRFNRKERYFVVTEAQGSPLRLGESFRQELSRVAGVPVPPDAFIATDFHLDWLYAALEMAAGLPEGEPRLNSEGGVTGTQEDIDLLVAFGRGPITRLLLVEAKGATGWTNKQLQSKAERLKILFPEPTRRVVAEPSFVLCSPREPRRVDVSGWPHWMAPDGAPRWMRLAMPHDRVKVVRTGHRGRPNRAGRYFTVRPT